jgi:thiamine-phosphate pyrophosphorylase
MSYRPLSAPELRLLGIVGPPIVVPTDVVDAARAAVADGAGVTAIQLRAKALPTLELLRLAEALVTSLPVPVYVNDRADVAVAAGAHGVHVGAEDLQPSAIRAWEATAATLRIGVSVGDGAEARAASLEPSDYWSIGAVFATGTKADAGRPIGPAGFCALAALAPPGVPAIAIGGITAANARGIIAAGASGVAVSAGIFAAGDVTAAARELRAMLDDAMNDRETRGAGR